MTSLIERLEELRKTQSTEEARCAQLEEQKREETLRVEGADQEMLEQIKQELRQKAEFSFMPILKMINKHYLKGKGEIETGTHLHGKPDDPIIGEYFSKHSHAAVLLKWNPKNYLIIGVFLDNSVSVQGGNHQLNINEERLLTRLGDEQWKSVVEDAALKILENKSYVYIPPPEREDYSMAH